MSVGVFMIRLPGWGSAPAPGQAARAGALHHLRRRIAASVLCRQLSGGFGCIMQTLGRILSQQRRLVPDRLDIGDADEAKPPVEIVRLEIESVFGWSPRRENTAGINHRRLLALEQSEIALRRIETEQQSGLCNDVDIELEPIGNA